MVRYGRLGVAGVPDARLDRSEALRYLGYTGQQVDQALLTRFNKLADECEKAIKPVFAWSVFDIDEKLTRWEVRLTHAMRRRMRQRTAARYQVRKPNPGTGSCLKWHWRAAVLSSRAIASPSICTGLARLR